MEIKNFTMTKLRNEEHFQFQTEFCSLINKETPLALGIAGQYATYQVQYDNESEALNVIRKSSFYQQITEANVERNNTFRGLSYSIKSSCLHFNPVIKQAALRVKIVFDQYTTLTQKSFNQETASINNLISRLNHDFPTEVTTLGIADWLTHLQTENTAFDTLMSSRHSEDASKTQLRMEQVRLNVDAAYQAITKRINALIELNGDAAYNLFVSELNDRIDFYRNNLAIRSGKNTKDDTTDTSSSK